MPVLRYGLDCGNELGRYRDAAAVVDVGEDRRRSGRHDIPLCRFARLQPFLRVHLLVLRLHGSLPGFQGRRVPVVVRARLASAPFSRLRVLLPCGADEGEADAAADGARTLSAEGRRQGRPERTLAFFKTKMICSSMS